MRVYWENRYGPNWWQMDGAREFIQYYRRSDSVQRNAQNEGGEIRRLAMTIAADRNEDVHGPPAEIPGQLCSRIPLPGQEVSVVKRRSTGGSAPEDKPVRKPQKKKHKKFDTAEKGQEYAAWAQENARAATPDPDRVDQAGSPSRVSSEPGEGAAVHNPENPPDGGDEKCILCGKSKKDGQAVPCAICGRNQFCCLACKDSFQKKHCCYECWKEHLSDPDSDDGRKNKEPCLNCGRDRRRTFEHGYSCIHCGQRRFCSFSCRENYGEAHCSPQCHEFSELAAEQEWDGAECVVCADPIDASIGRAVPCHGCSSMQFCRIECKDSHAEFDGHCSAMCKRFMGDKSDSEDDGYSAAKGEVSILNDPRNYQLPADDDEMPNVPDLIPDAPPPREINVKYAAESGTILDHRLVDHGRELQYHLQDNTSKETRWLYAVGLEGSAWTNKLRDYWAQSERKRQLSYLQGKPAHKLRFKPSFGRHIRRMEVEQHRLCLFKRVDFGDENKEHKGKKIWEYGAGLDSA